MLPNTKYTPYNSYCDRDRGSRHVAYTPNYALFYLHTSTVALVPGGQINIANVAAKSSGGTCVASHIAQSHDCFGAIDGDSKVGWATNVLTNGEWLQVNFAYPSKVIQVDMYNFCMNAGQCDRWSLTFDDGTTLQVCFLCTKCVLQGIIAIGFNLMLIA
jgi:hypothetical protein